MKWSLAPFFISSAFISCTNPEFAIEPAEASGGSPSQTGDSDGDGISDDLEGAAIERDTDDDGSPDFLDDDSDNDGLSDKIEGNGDADDDHLPDYLDLDSDKNGIPDAQEGAGDLDKDGLPDRTDLDDDQDGAIDAEEILAAKSDCNDDGTSDPLGTNVAPANCDADAEKNFRDRDSDGDGIADLFEGSKTDTDKDGFLNRYEHDADNDGLTDAEELRGEALDVPADTDGDNTPDYLDPDSDGDGLSDWDETEIGSSPIQSDTDSDGASDLVEHAAGTDPSKAASNPTAQGHFVFLVPYQGPTVPERDTLDFETDIKYADVYFGFDTTTSMGAELDAMQNATKGVPAIVNAVRCGGTEQACTVHGDCTTAGEICFASQCIDNPSTANGGKGCVPDLWTGVGRWDELNTFENLLSVQADPVLTAQTIPFPVGGSSKEAPYQAPVCIAAPSLCPNAKKPMNCALSGVGCPGFRTEAVRIYVQITDADDQCGSATECATFTPDFAGQALKDAGIKFVSLWGTGDDSSDPGTAMSVAEELCVASGTVQADGTPFAFPAIDAAVVDTTVDALFELTKGLPLKVTIEATDAVGDAGNALQFLDYLEVNVAGTPACTHVTTTADTDADSHHDAFPALLGGTPVCWDVVPVIKNTSVPATASAQLFKATLTVLGDGSPLDSRGVYFLVPPTAAVIPDPPPK